MKVRFQADADLDGRVLRGLKRIAPEIDIRSSAESDLAGLPDEAVLQLSATSGRILVSQDRRTMPYHFATYIMEARSPGVILLRSEISIASAIEELALIWGANAAEEWIDQLVWIPL